MGKRYNVTSKTNAGIDLYDPADSPLALWNFNGDLIDSSGSGLTLSDDVGTAAFADGTSLHSYFPDSVPAPPRQALNSAATDRLIGGAAPWDTLRTTGSISIQVWANPTSFPDTSCYVCSQGNANSTAEAENILWSMSITSTGLLRFVSQFGAGTSEAKTAGSGITLGSWHHLAITRSGGTALTFYINGEQVGTATNTTPTGGTDGEFVVGDLFGAGNYDGYLAGLQIQNSVVSPEKIRDNYLRGRQGF